MFRTKVAIIGGSGLYQMEGMTAFPEAKLAREAEMCYASLAFVTSPQLVPERVKKDLALLIGRNIK